MSIWGKRVDAWFDARIGRTPQQRKEMSPVRLVASLAAVLFAVTALLAFWAVEYDGVECGTVADGAASTEFYATLRGIQDGPLGALAVRAGCDEAVDDRRTLLYVTGGAAFAALLVRLVMVQNASRSSFSA